MNTCRYNIHVVYVKTVKQTQLSVNIEITDSFPVYLQQWFLFKHYEVQVHLLWPKGRYFTILEKKNMYSNRLTFGTQKSTWNSLQVPQGKYFPIFTLDPQRQYLPWPSI